METMTLLTTAQELDALVASSEEQPVFIFKHSLTCSISSAAFAEYRRFVATRAQEPGLRFGLIEIQRHRDLSNQLASRTGIRHESPQAILFSGGHPRWSASHGAITARSLAASLERLAEG